MEIRCGGCNKLFRIPDEKITGKGIKFACTRCGESVRVTKEEFEQYALSKSAVSVLDLFEEKTKPSKDPLPPETGKTIAEEPSLADQQHERSEPAAVPLMQEAPALPVEEHPAISEPAARDSAGPEPPAPPFPDVLQEEPAHQTEAASPSAEPLPEAQISAEPVPAPQPERKSPEEAQAEEQQFPTAEPTPESQQQTPSRPEQAMAAKTVPAVKPAIAEPKAVRPPERERGHETIEHPRPAGSASGSPGTPTLSQHEPAPYAPPVRGRGPLTSPETPSRSMNMFLVYSVMLILISLVGYGVFMLIGPGTRKTDGLLKELSSTEGLRIISASGSVDPKGDLVITCMIENSLNKERPVWYVVVDVYNTEGSVLSRIRSINGKQLFTQRDYDIFSKRGENIQDLKLKNLQDQGFTIPPKGSATFEIRYLQPANGVASFNALVHPFDPVRLLKELVEEIQQ
jgi:hypothetical protein